jgi:hypothetical protein
MIMPVTEQGLKAAAEVERTVEAVKPTVLTFITHGTESVTPSTLVNYFAELGYHKDVIREAMWRLLDSNQVDLTSSLALEVVDNV